MDPNTKKVQWFCEYLQKGLSWSKESSATRESTEAL